MKSSFVVSRAILVLALMLTCLPAFSQAPKTTPAPAATAPAPALTELQKTKMENLQLKFSLLQQQQTELQGQYSALIQSIVAEHPGYQWNPQSSSLVAVPKPAAADKK